MRKSGLSLTPLRFNP